MKARAPSRRVHEAGFSFIEAAIAAAIVAVALVPLLAAEVQLRRAAIANDRRLSDVAADEGALAILRDINVATSGTGKADLGAGRELIWTATPMTPFAHSFRPDGAPSDFDVAIFRVTATITAARADQRHAFTVDQVGWRRSDSAASRTSATAP